MASHQNEHALWLGSASPLLSGSYLDGFAMEAMGVEAGNQALKGIWIHCIQVGTRLPESKSHQEARKNPPDRPR